MKISEILPLIKPAKNRVSDKFSWNIYRYLRDNARTDVRICLCKKSFFDGSEIKYDQSKSIHAIQLYIFIGNGFIGNRIYDIMGRGEHSKIKSYSWVDYHNEFIDITQQFFDEYLMIGRCIFDRNHRMWWVGGDNQYSQVDECLRECKWCGQKLKKIVEYEPRERWITV